MIRTASEKDLTDIVQIHRICFPESFTTAMGKYLLMRYYNVFMTKNPELFLVSEKDTDSKMLTGFCMGYYGENSGCTKQFIKENRFLFALRVLFLLLIGNCAAWKRVVGVIQKKRGTVTLNELFCSFSHKDSGELLSICVLPDQRGSGTASQLVDHYTQVLVENGRRRCVLSVLCDNKRAIRFYEKKGFSLFKKIGDTSLVFAKILSNE